MTDSLQSLEAEKQLLGIILSHNETIDGLRGLVGPHQFAQPLHGRIFQAVCKQYTETGACNPITLKTVFGDDRAMADVGGIAYLIDLTADVITATRGPDYARIIVDLFNRRALQQIGTEIASRVGDHESSVEAQIGQAQRQLDDCISGASTEAIQPLSAAMDGVDALMEGRVPQGPTTGLRDLDQRIKGLVPTKLYVLAGRPGMGKSGLAISIADAAARTGVGVAIFSLEMSREEYAQRMIAMRCWLPSDQVHYSSLSDPRSINRNWLPRIREAQKQINSLPIMVDDRPGLDMAQIEGSILSARAKLRREHNTELSAVIIDHLMLVRAGKDYRGNKNLELGEISYALKAIAKRYNICVLALSQLSRAVERRDDKRPNLSDLRESGHIEENADAVMFAYRDEYYLAKSDDGGIEYVEAMHKAKNRMEIIVDKNRQGRTGALEVYCDIASNFFADQAHQSAEGGTVP